MTINSAEARLPQPPAARSPEKAEAQLLEYARDFGVLAAQDRDKAERLGRANAQLQIYAHDVNRAFVAEQKRARELEKAYLDTVRRLVQASRYKDEETGKHIARLSYYARIVAEYLDWGAKAVDLLVEATPMHDVGKLGVPDAVLLKPAPLDQQEARAMKRHTIFGASLLQGSASPLLELSRQIALSHHERWDGSGYPRGTKGGQTPRAARIVMLVDQYDALRSPRPYKPALTHRRTCDILLEGDGRTLPRHFDPQLLEAFRCLEARFRKIYDDLAG
jgi:putative two-component system response regulator